MDAVLALPLGGPHLQASPALSPTNALPKGQERGDRCRYFMRKLLHAQPPFHDQGDVVEAMPFQALQGCGGRS